MAKEKTTFLLRLEPSLKDQLKQISDEAIGSRSINTQILIFIKEGIDNN